MGSLLRRQEAGGAVAKPVGQTFRDPEEEEAGDVDGPTFGLLHTRMSVYAEMGKQDKVQPAKGWGLCSNNVSFKCGLPLYLILGMLNVLIED